MKRVKFVSSKPRDLVSVAARFWTGSGIHAKTEKVKRRDLKIALLKGKEVYQSLGFR